MAIYRTSKFKSSLIPGLIAALLVAPAGTALAQQADNTATEQDIFVGDNQSTYGPIKASDTLWKIANAYRPDDSVTNYQVMVALFKTNPNAFVNNDINFLIQGQYLRIPTLAQINEVVPFHRQNDSDNSLTKINQAIASNIKPQAGEEVLPVNSESAEPTSQPIQAEPETDSKQLLAEIEPSVQDSQVQATSATTGAANEDVASAEQVVSEPTIASVETESEPVQSLKLEGVNEPKAEPVSEPEAQVSNREVEESLAAVGVKLDDLQYELERSKQTQAELDKKLEEQNALLLQAKKREQKLMAEQAALKKQNDGLFNNPIAYWSVSALLFILLIVLTVLVQRRRRVEKELLALKPQLAANKAKAQQAIQNIPANTEKVAKAKSDSKSEPVKSETEKVKEASVLQPSSVLFDGGLGSKTQTPPAPAIKEKAAPARDPIAEAFAKVDLKDSHVEPDELVSEADLLANLVKNEANDTLDNDLNMDHIIDDMVDEDTKAKPAKLHSDTQSTGEIDLSSAQLKEIEDFDDVEFDKLLEEISNESQHVVVDSKSQEPAAEVESVSAYQAVAQDPKNFVEIDELIAESESSTEEPEPYQEGKIDVGLDEFPEFTQNVNPVNVDDDKHGVNAKLDLAQVYIEIGDEDNAAVILKNVMKLGNSSQQQQAQQLLYSLKS